MEMRNHKKLTRDIILEFFKWINGNKRLKKENNVGRNIYYK
jgi:hypothetical protein